MLHMKKKIIISVIVLIFIGIAYYLIAPAFIVKEANDALPEVDFDMSGPMTVEPIEEILSGELIESAHSVSGFVRVYDTKGMKTLRFEDLDTINGPDLFIYLATDTTAEDFVNLGEVKATKGNVNYEIPPNVDLEKYDTVLIWCRAFRVLFSYAELE